MVTRADLRAILADTTKRIEGDLAWADDKYHRPSQKFRACVLSDRTASLEIAGYWNPKSEKLSYTLLHRGAGRIYALDLGAMHRNPRGDRVGPTHKHRWTDEFRDKLAYTPEDITASWDQPVQVWQQFCDEALISHDGVLDRPVWQEEFVLDRPVRQEELLP